MPRVYIVVGIVILALSIYSVIDSLLTDRRRVRGLPKVLWVIVIVLLPVIGPALWFIVGKDRASRRPISRQTAPDDDPEFLRRLGSEKEQEERIRRLEQELADLDDDSSTKD